MSKTLKGVSYKCCHNCKHVKRGKPCDHEGQLHAIMQAMVKDPPKKKFVCGNWVACGEVKDA